jgi:phenylpropionate dioxygenase-like ring-hydroxylating dioxygenase large terminal subunit
VAERLRATREAGVRDLVRELEDTVRPREGHIPSYIFGDPDVYRMEVERIFGRCWLFVAHESEVPKRGDYVTRYMGEQSVIVVRGEDDEVRVFLNMCKHRGMRVCRSDQNNTSHFRCPYHGFTYKNTGQLTGVPAKKEAYGDALDKSQIQLHEARSNVYAGLIFATWDEDAASLEDYLGDMKWYLDILVGRASMEVTGPPHRWEMPCNWKLPSENFMSDAYHTMHTHASIPKLGLAPSARFAKDGYHVYAGNGHGLGIGMPAPAPIFAEEVLPEFEERLSEDQAAVIKETKNLHATVFPNLSFLISAMTMNGEIVSHTDMRVWIPRGPDRIVIYSWCLMESSASEEWKDQSHRAYVSSFGPSGMFEQDDSENWEDITRNADSGPAARHFAFEYLQGMGRKQAEDFPGPGQVYEGKFSEANARAFYQHWLNLVLDSDQTAPAYAGAGGNGHASESTVERQRSST